MACHHFTEPLTSAVRDRIVPVSCLQAAESSRADHLVPVLAAEHHLTAHQKVAAASVAKLRRAGVLTLHRLWWEHMHSTTHKKFCHDFTAVISIS